MPSAPSACAPADASVVYPRLLSDAVAGSPRGLRPYAGSAHPAAVRRHGCRREMRARNNRNGTVLPALPQSPYPSVKIDPGSDRTEDERGHNCGRAARYGWPDDCVDAPPPFKSVSRGHSWARLVKFCRLFRAKAQAPAAITAAVDRALRPYPEMHPYCIPYAYGRQDNSGRSHATAPGYSRGETRITSAGQSGNDTAHKPRTPG